MYTAITSVINDSWSFIAVEIWMSHLFFFHLQTSSCIPITTTARGKTSQTHKSILILRCCQGDLSIAVHASVLTSSPTNGTHTLCLHLRGKPLISDSISSRLWGEQFSWGRGAHLSLSHELDMHLITSSAVSSNTLRNPNMSSCTNL